MDEAGMPAAANKSDEIRAIRDSVRVLRGDSPGAYWRDRNRDRAYPTEFVGVLAKAGFVAALIPEDYGGLDLPRSY